MKRVLVIGAGGAGKSTFARRLSQVTGINVVHLDQRYWRAGWVEPSKTEWASTVAQLIAPPAWIVDGNYGGTLDMRLAVCDTVVFLDVPRLTCIVRVLRRYAKYRGRARPDMTDGCPEQLSLTFLQWIWRYPIDRRPQILARLEALSADKQIVVLRTSDEIERFLGSASQQNGR